MRLRLITTLVAALLVSACATNPPLALNLRDPVTPENLLIAHRASFVKLQGLLNVRWEYGLMPGAYAAEKENDLGTFYRGSGRPIWARGGTETVPAQLFLGGVWVPKSESEVPRLYIIRDNALHTTKDLDQYTFTYSQNLIVSGQPVGPSVAGSVIGGAIVGAILQAEAGTIYIHDASGDAKFDRHLKEAVKSRTRSR